MGIPLQHFLIYDSAAHIVRIIDGFIFGAYPDREGALRAEGAGIEADRAWRQPTSRSANSIGRGRGLASRLAVALIGRGDAEAAFAGSVKSYTVSQGVVAVRG
jgi:hypothetical protein